MKYVRNILELYPIKCKYPKAYGISRFVLLCLSKQTKLETGLK